MSDDRRKMSSEARVSLFLAAGAVIVAAVSFWARGADLPARVGCLEMAQAKTEQFKDDLTTRLARIEKKIDDLSK